MASTLDRTEIRSCRVMNICCGRCSPTSSANALVHTPSTSSVTVTIATDEETVTVTIADAGPGMDAETATRAFERFVRADPARTREHGGSGLGLAIAHDAVEAHGGSVTLRSDLDRGTVVEVRLRR